MQRLINQPPEQIATLNDKRDVVVIILGANRQDGEHITDGQQDVAMNMAKSGLQLAGATVSACSTAFLLSDDEFQEGEELIAKVNCELWKETTEEPETEGETGGDPSEGETETEEESEESTEESDGETPPNGELNDEEETTSED